MTAMVLVLALASAPPALDTERVYDPMSTGDMEALARRLLLHVPLLEIEVSSRADTLDAGPRTGFGVVLSPSRVLCQSHLLTDAEAVALVGPKGKVTARVLFVDHERRVAMLEPEGELSKAGLHPVAGWVPKSALEPGMPVFALVSTLELSGVSQGVVTHAGRAQEYEGHPRIDLRLTRGMPVFDNRARLLGISRVVAWDRDRYMVIPREKIRASRTSSAARARPPAPKTPKRPWWAK